MVSHFPVFHPTCKRDKKTQLEIVLMFCQKYPVVSPLEIMECCLKQWSLAWQLSLPAVTTPSLPFCLLIKTSSHPHVRRKPSQLLSTSSSGFTLRNVKVPSQAMWPDSRLAQLLQHHPSHSNLSVTREHSWKLPSVQWFHSQICWYLAETKVCPVVSGLQSGLVLLH